MAPETKNQDEKLRESVNWPEFLDELWRKGKTAAGLSKKGVSMEICGEVFIVRHNRRDESAFLRLQSASDPQKKILVTLRSAYLLEDAEDRYGKPEINSLVNVSSELHGRMVENADFVAKMDDGAGVDEVHETLQRLTQICDITTDIKRFRLNWDGDIMQLLPHSLLDQLYEMVRVSPEGALVLNNYKALSNDGHTVEQYERDSGIGIQKAINIREGIVTERDAEDVEVYITDERIRKHIQDVMKKTNMSPHHPLFQQLYDFYCSIVLQVKSTRDRLQHLLPVRPNEPLRVRIGTDKLKGRAYFETRATRRGKARFLNLEEEHHHAYMTYPPNRYKEFDPQNPVNLAINPGSLRAETRHHIHYMNLDVLDQKLPGGLQGSGIAEMVDDMQLFPTQYWSEKKHPSRDRLLNSGVHWWSLMVLVDSGHLSGVDGHIYTGHVLHSLAEKFAKREKPLTPGEFEIIDKAVFDFLSHVEVKEGSMESFCATMSRIRHLIRLNSPRTLIDNEMITLRRIMNMSPKARIGKADMEKFNVLANRYEDYKRRLKFLVKKYYDRRSDNFLLDPLFVDCAGDRIDLAEFMTEHIPFRAPNGKNYPSPAAYYLNPNVLYEEIIRRFPQLAVS